MTLVWRYAADSDIPLLAQWNRQLIEDESHRNSMSLPELEARLKTWLADGYQAALFSVGRPVAYALFKGDPGHIYLRQFFVQRDQRRHGIGRNAFDILRKEIWPASSRFTVDVLCHNQTAIAFWRSVGFSDYALTLEIMPEKEAN